MLTDPEINAALAEKAMGWKKVCVGSFPPDYLTDPTASHALKGAMRAKIENFRRLEINILPDTVAVMIATGTDDVDECYPFVAEDPSELRAVAFAACRALGIEGV